MAHPSVLVVDDNADLSSLFTAVLRKAGFDVDESGSAGDAIGRIGERHYDAVLVESSPAAGFQPLFEAMAAKPEGLSHVVVATTDFEQTELLNELAGRGVFRVLRKPLTAATLTAAIRDCAGS
jgi:DNA-binding NtrC family response regulator